MEISRRTDYAIRIIAALIQNEGMPLSVSAAAKLQDVPYSFARSIQHDLTKNGIVTTLRGAQGGMVLAVDPDELTLAQLVETVQGPIQVAACLAENGWCPRDNSCAFHKVWISASKMLNEYLSSISIKEILEGKSPSLPGYSAN